MGVLFIIANVLSFYLAKLVGRLIQLRFTHRIAPAVLLALVLMIILTIRVLNIVFNVVVSEWLDNQLIILGLVVMSDMVAFQKYMLDAWKPVRVYQVVRKYYTYLNIARLIFLVVASIATMGDFNICIPSHFNALPESINVIPPFYVMPIRYQSTQDNGERYAKDIWLYKRYGIFKVLKHIFHPPVFSELHESSIHYYTRDSAYVEDIEAIMFRKDEALYIMYRGEKTPSIIIK